MRLAIGSIETDISSLTAFCGNKIETLPSELITLPPAWDIIFSGVLKNISLLIIFPRISCALEIFSFIAFPTYSSGRLNNPVHTVAL